jgi:hypothetical protein
MHIGIKYKWFVHSLHKRKLGCNMRFTNSRYINKCSQHKGLVEMPDEFPVGQNLSNPCGECGKTFFRDNTVQVKIAKGVRKLTVRPSSRPRSNRSSRRGQTAHAGLFASNRKVYRFSLKLFFYISSISKRTFSTIMLALLANLLLGPR